jgi:hypothetical protein
MQAVEPGLAGIAPANAVGGRNPCASITVKRRMPPLLFADDAASTQEKLGRPAT